MSATLIIQSHRAPLPYPWIGHCLESVRAWCDLNHYEYCFVGDELFDDLPAVLLDKTQQQKVVATDLARLLVIRNALKSGYETVVWLDADFLIFNPAEFILPDDTYALGREVWVQTDKRGKLKAYKKVHNAFLMFKKANSFLDFYTETAQGLLSKNHGSIPPQFIGPKLLTALHNIVQLPVMETAGMLCPMVIKDLLKGVGPALTLFCEQSLLPIAAANLCTSSCDRQELSATEMADVIRLLMENSCSVGA